MSEYGQLLIDVYEAYSQDAGYGGMRETDDGSLVLMWDDGAPTPKRLPAGVALEVVQYSEAELASAAYDLAVAGRDSGVTTVAPSSDRSGLEVGLEPTGTASRDATSPETALDSAELPDVGVPIVGVHFAGVDSDYGRQNTDGAQGIGGHRIAGANNAGCTAGIPVIFNDTGLPGMVSAYHCTINGGAIWKDGAGHYFGYLRKTYSTNDVMALETTRSGYAPTPGWAPFAYANAWNGTGTSATDMPWMQGWTPPVSGATWVLSGSYSGVVSGNVIKDYPATINYDFGTVQNQVILENNAGVAASGEGDSGGPVFRFIDPYTVTAAGTISGHDHTTNRTCQGVQDRSCGWRTYVAPYSVWRNLLNVTVMPSA